MGYFADLNAQGTEKYSSTSAENTVSVTQTQSVFFGCDGRNTDASNAVYIMIFDLAAAPTGASKPVITFGVPAAGTGVSISNGNFSYATNRFGIKFTNGIAIAASSTDAPTFTAVATNKTIFHVDYAHEDGTSSV